MIDFAQSDCDVAIRWSNDDGKGLIYHRLVRGVYTPMLHPDLAETIGGLKKPEDLLRLRIIDPGDIWWHQWFQEVGVENPGLDRYPRSRLNVQAFEAAAAIASQGVAMLTLNSMPMRLHLAGFINPSSTSAVKDRTIGSSIRKTAGTFAR